jgi:hypothetical protein
MKGDIMTATPQEKINTILNHNRRQRKKHTYHLPFINGKQHTVVKRRDYNKALLDIFQLFQERYNYKTMTKACRSLGVKYLATASLLYDGSMRTFPPDLEEELIKWAATSLSSEEFIEREHYVPARRRSRVTSAANVRLDAAAKNKPIEPAVKAHPSQRGYKSEEQKAPEDSAFEEAIEEEDVLITVLRNADHPKVSFWNSFNKSAQQYIDDFELKATPEQISKLVDVLMEVVSEQEV